MPKVVNGVKGDPAFGEDCDLYEAMGYVRKSERKSGLSRKKGGDTRGEIAAREGNGRRGGWLPCGASRFGLP